jgi:hypothetical protein
MKMKRPLDLMLIYDAPLLHRQTQMGEVEEKQYHLAQGGNWPRTMV